MLVGLSSSPSSRFLDNRCSIISGRIPTLRRRIQGPLRAGGLPTQFFYHPARICLRARVKVEDSLGLVNPPVMLAGPLLRRIEPNLASGWVALNAVTTSIQLSLREGASIKPCEISSKSGLERSFAETGHSLAPDCPLAPAARTNSARESRRHQAEDSPSPEVWPCRGNL